MRSVREVHAISIASASMGELCALPAIAKPENGVRETQLREDENCARDVQRQIVLMVDQRAAEVTGAARKT